MMARNAKRTESEIEAIKAEISVLRDERSREEDENFQSPKLKEIDIRLSELYGVLDENSDGSIDPGEDSDAEVPDDLPSAPASPVGSPDVDLKRRFRELVRAAAFSAAEGLVESPSLDPGERDRLREDLARSRAAYEELRLADLGEAIHRRDFKGARKLRDDITEALGGWQGREAADARIEVAEATDTMRRIREELALDVEPSDRPMVPLDPALQGRVNDLVAKGAATSSLVGMREAIQSLEVRYLAEAKRRAEAIAERRTAADQGSAHRLLALVQLDKDRGRDVFLMPGLTEDRLLPIETALIEVRMLITRRANDAVERRVRSARGLVEQGDLNSARAKLEEARRDFWADADEERRKDVDACSEEVRDYEVKRARHEARLGRLGAVAQLADAMAVIDHVQADDPHNPTLRGAIEAVVRRFRGLLVAQVGRARAQAPAAGLRLLDGATTDLEMMQRLLPYLPVEGTGEGSIAQSVRDDLDTLSRRIDDARRELRAESQRLERWQVARDQLEAWLGSASSRDVGAGQQLVATLQDDPSEGSRALIARATPLLDIEWRVAEVRRRLRARDPDGARRMLVELQGGEIERRLLASLTSAAGRLDEFMQASLLLEERTSESVSRASVILERLKLDPSSDDGFASGDAQRLHGEAERLVTEIRRTREVLADARADMESRQFARARKAVEGARTELLDLASMRRKLLSENDGLWIASLHEALLSASRTDDVDRVCSQLAVRAEAFPDEQLPREVARACFEALARTWEQPGTHVDRIARAVSAADAISTGPDDRDRVVRGVRELAQRRDIPAIRDALTARNGARARDLLSALDSARVDPEAVASLWVETYVLLGDFPAAKNCVAQVGDGQLAAGLEARIAAAEARAREVAGVARRMDANIRDLREARDTSQVQAACRDAETMLATPAIRETAPRIAELWDEAIRAFETAQVDQIERAGPGMTLAQRLVPFERLRAIGRLSANHQARYEQLVSDARQPIQEALLQATRLNQQVSPSEDAITRTLDEIALLIELVAARVPGPQVLSDQQQLRRASDELGALAESLRKLDMLRQRFADIKGAVRDEVAISSMRDVLSDVPARFTGNPSHEYVVAMRSQLTEIERDWQYDSKLERAIVASWKAGDYLACSRYAGQAEEERLLQRDRFELKANVNVPHGFGMLIGAKAIRDAANGKRAEQNLWTSFVADARTIVAPVDADVEALCRDFAGPQRYRAHVELGQRVARLDDRCIQAAKDLTEKRPSNPGQVLTDDETRDWLTEIRALEQRLADRRAELRAIVVGLQADEEAANGLRAEVERCRSVYETSSVGPWWNKQKDPDAQDALDQAIARLRQVRPNEG